jgi:hypothetical protein
MLQSILIANELDLAIWGDLHVFSPSDYDEVAFAKPFVYMHVCMYPRTCIYIYIYGWRDGCMCASLARERFDGFDSYSVLTKLRIIGQFRMNTNILGPKVEALQTGSKTQNAKILENGS